MTDRPDYRAHLRQRLKESTVPEGLHEGLVEYFSARRPTGGFLTAVLENDFKQAAVRADVINRYFLRELALFLINDCPAPAWGSPEQVTAWLRDQDPVPEIFD